jgi:PKD repeat protein
MKGSLAIVGIACIIAGLVVFAYFFGYFDGGENNEEPQAKIEISNVLKSNGQETIIVNIGDKITFNAENSTDNDGQIKSYNWDYGDGTSESGISQSHAYSKPGFYNVTLTVVDDDGGEDITWLIIKVNTPPHVEAILDTNATRMVKSNVLIYDPVYFLATSCYDPDGAHYSGSDPSTWPMDIEYHWEFGDGNFSVSQNPSHEYKETGTYIVELIVTDKYNAQSTDSFNIEVILRSYNITWKIENGSISDSGYATEFTSTTRTYTVDPSSCIGLAEVVFHLEWQDWLPVINATAGPDEFELSVTSPDGSFQRINGTNDDHTGILELTYTFNPEPENSQESGKNLNDARLEALTKCTLDDEGIGDWFVNITAVDCIGWDFIGDIFDLDAGSNWNLEITFNYYVIEVAEIDYT